MARTLREVIADAIRSTGHVTNHDKWEAADAVIATLLSPSDAAQGSPSMFSLLVNEPFGDTTLGDILCAEISAGRLREHVERVEQKYLSGDAALGRAFREQIERSSDSFPAVGPILDRARELASQHSDAAQGESFEFGGYCGTCGSPCDDQGRSIHGHNGSQPVRVDELEQEWADAYAAFKGAFDTPAERRKRGDEYATYARERLRKFNERMETLAAHKGEGNG